MLFLFFVFLLCVYFIRMHWDQERKRVNLPGPKTYPIVGAIFGVNPKVHEGGFELHRDHGKLVYNRVGNTHMVSTGDAKLAKEFFSMDEVTGRPMFDFFSVYEGEMLGIGQNEGENWETIRRFTLRQLRDFGFGKTSMETLIMDEVNELVENLKKKNGAPVKNVKDIFTLAVVNSLWTLVNGKRYKQDDPKIIAVANNLAKVFIEPVKSGGIIFFMPWLRYIMPKFIGYTGIREAFEGLKVFVEDAINEHKRTFVPEFCRDFIDVYLKEGQSPSAPKQVFHGKIGEKQLVATVADLFIAGSDTTSTTLSWLVLYLAKSQKIQKKLYDQILSVTGGTRNVSTSDKPDLPYLLAVIDETLRMSTILPGGLLHKVTSEITHNGVTYPKGTLIGSTLYYIHRNPEVWKNPTDFVPERFLSEDEKSYKKHEQLIAFSVGKRNCIGETLARQSLFLFIGNIVQNFHIIFDPNEPEPDFEPAPGFTLNPQSYSVIFKNRN